MMGLQNTAIVCVLLVCGLGAFQVAAQCGECMSNSAQCIDERRFYFCSQGKPSTSNVLSCDEDHVCTSTNSICVKRDEVDPNTFVCESKCNKCPALSENFNRFACVSTTQYALCSNGEPLNVVGSCDAGEYCNMDLYKKYGNICAPFCVLSYYNYEFTCMNDVYTTTTTVATTVVTEEPNPEVLRQQCIQGKPSTPRSYFNVPNPYDANCRTYIYCEERDNLMVSFLLTCKAGFFNKDLSRCTNDRPASCRPTVTPSTTTPTTPGVSVSTEEIATAGISKETTTTEEPSTTGNSKETTTTVESSTAGNSEETTTTVESSTAGNSEETTTTVESLTAGNSEETTTTEEPSTAGNPEETVTSGNVEESPIIANNPDDTGVPEEE